MIISEKPLIYLLNTDLETHSKLVNTYNASHFWMNGYQENISSNRSLFIPYKKRLPDNIHEAEIVVIDTAHRNVIIGDDNASLHVQYDHTPSFVDLLPLDMSAVIKNIFSSEKKQLIFVFCESYNDEKYTLLNDFRSFNYIQTNTYCFPDPVSLKEVIGERMSIAQGEHLEEIKQCINKYLEGSYYNFTFRIRTGEHSTDTPLLINESTDVVSCLRIINNKMVFFLLSIKDQAGFIEDLFLNILPDLKGFDSFFPENGKFKWTKDFSYISVEERNKSLEIEEELKRHALTLTSLKEDYERIHNKDENVKLRNMLKETGDDLVSAVKWFLEYIGFSDVVDPDKDVDVDAGEVFEEDLNFEHNGVHFLLEVKGIGGTSTDAQCAQISKIALRRKKANQGNTYKAVYIVNHRRYKAPKERELIPFNENQITDAEIANRGMTFTYELFNIYHMIEAGVISKEAAREAFKQEGLIDFRHSLHRLDFNHCYTGASVYSLVIPEGSSFTITKADKIAIQDNENHWHQLSIVSMEIDRVAYEEVSSGKVGIKVDRLVPGARDYYVVKVSEDKGLQDA